MNRQLATTGNLLILAIALMTGGCAKSLDVGLASTGGSDGQTSGNANYLVTSRYYDDLISGAAPKIAELSLFTNLMPKGGDLHHHYSGAIYVETYLDWVGASGFCICRDELCQSRNATGTESVSKFGIVKNLLSGRCLGVEKLRTDKSQARFYRELLTLWSNKDFSNHFHEQPAPDQQFFDTFGFFGPVSDYCYHEGLQSLKQRAIAENVGYLETMLKSAPAEENSAWLSILNALGPHSTDQQIERTLSSAVDLLAADPVVKSAIDEYAASHQAAAAGLDDSQFKLRFLTYVSRNSEPGKLFSGLYAAFAATKRSPLIVGVNMVGPENGYIAMRDYSLHMKMLRFLKQRFPDVKVSLHAGELVLGMVPPEGLKYHIDEAVNVAGADRIGHGVDIVHENAAYGLFETMRNRHTVVEINLTSNAFILGVEGNAHPLRLYRQQQVPFVISTDDAGVSRNNLSNEYLLFASRYRPYYGELKTVVYNSIDHAFLNQTEKASARQDLDRRFAGFEAEIATRAGYESAD